MHALSKYSALGRPLTKEEVDGNWSTIEDAISDALSGALPVAAILLHESESGQYLRFLDGSGDTLASIPFPAMLVQSGAWSTGIAYTTRHLVTNSGGSYICISAHTAGTFATDLAAGKWFQLGSNAATSIAFSPGSSGLEATTMQAAILELVENLDAVAASIPDIETPTATEISITAITGVTGSNVQAALSSLKALIDDIDTGGGPGGPVEAIDVSFTPVGVLTSTTVQDAIAEVASLIPEFENPTASDVAITAISGVSGTTVQAALASLKSQITTGGSGGATHASELDYDDTASGLVADNVQDAIDAVAANQATAVSDGASGVSFDTGSSGIGSSNLQGALTEVIALIAAIRSDGAAGVAFAPGSSGIEAIDVQQALLELAARITALEAA